jgi:hypothetical protein
LPITEETYKDMRPTIVDTERKAEKTEEATDAEEGAQQPDSSDRSPNAAKYLARDNVDRRSKNIHDLSQCSLVTCWRQQIVSELTRALQIWGAREALCVARPSCLLHHRSVGARQGRLQSASSSYIKHANKKPSSV